MVNYVALNCSNDRKRNSQNLERMLNNVFRYTRDVNVHVLYDFLCPTNRLGKFEFIIFIDIPYAQGNYYRNKEKVYLNSLAIAFRKFEEPEVIDADNTDLYTEDGSWNYKNEIAADKSALRDYVYTNIPNIKHFDIQIVYHIRAPKCNKTFDDGNISFNCPIRPYEFINNAINQTKDSNGLRTSCISYDDGTTNDWSKFISNFIVSAETHTKQGILTKKKVDSITKANTSRLMDQVYSAAGNRMCIIGGKAGTGKTHALMKIMYNEVRKGNDAPHHNCRLLTYNNMLVADIKQAMKQIGDFTPTKASVSTLHKFFYSIYISSPVKDLHMDKEKIDKIFSKCVMRVLKANSLISKYAAENNNEVPNVKLALKNMQQYIKTSEAYEIREYGKYLSKIKISTLADLSGYAEEYVAQKRKKLEEEYHRNVFLNGYTEILKELYLIFHNLDEFIATYGLNVTYSVSELRQTEEFKAKYQEVYNNFLRYAEEKFAEEDLTEDELLPVYRERLRDLEDVIKEELRKKSEDENRQEIEQSLKKIKRKVNWSKLVLVDEAQDCQIYEKALLLELFGSDNTIIATGGKDQLIRTASENDWTQLFGSGLVTEKITLRSVSHRQKGNIVNFLNAFAEEFNLDTLVSCNEEMNNQGRVLIDCRTTDEDNSIPEDRLKSLYLNGKDAGCSNFENIMILFPRNGFVARKDSEDFDVTIDENDTVHINASSGERMMALNLPSYLNPMDGTINDKRTFLEHVGQDNTRCLLYDSCRGLEAWNVMCVNFDNFYYERCESVEAEEYATSNGGGLFREDIELYRNRYASLWCYMALTRAIDTLYIRFIRPNSEFAQRVLNVAKRIPEVEILKGPINA